MGIPCIFRNGEWGEERKQVLSAVTAPVVWLGLTGTTTVSLGAACLALALAGTRYKKKWEGNLAFFIFVYFNLSGLLKTTGIF